MNEDAFLSALRESPDDELTWLALADWLDENGQAERAELLRAVRRLRTMPVMKRGKPRMALEGRIAELLATGVRPVTPEVTNDVGMRLALIPPGRFRMGSPRTEKGRYNDELAHEVILTRPFYLSVFTVTQAQYRAVMGTNPSFFRHDGQNLQDVADIPDGELANFPVEGVSWPDAQQFLKMLNARASAKALGLLYHLPTEAEWEYAARAHTSSPFHCGASLSSQQANFNGQAPYGGAKPGPNLQRTCAVGSYMPNAFGLYDMHGNVWEWCADFYGPYEVGPLTDPAGMPEGSERVIRGGCRVNDGDGCRAANRHGNAPATRGAHLGIRVAADRRG